MLNVHTAPLALDDTKPGDELSELGAVAGLQFTDGPNGSADCQFSVDYPVNGDSSLLRLPRRVVVSDGPWPCWHGVLESAPRGRPWQCTAIGLAPYAAQFPARYSSPPNTAGFNAIEDVIDNAISDGAPIRRPFAWTNPWTPTHPAPSNPGLLGDMLGLYAKTVGGYWHVDTLGNLLHEAALPTSPTWLIDAVDTPGGVSSVGFYTKFVVIFQDATTTKLTYQTYTNDFWWDLGWQQGTTIDLTSYGPLAGATVDLFMTNVMTAVTPAPTMTGSITVHDQHLLTYPGGAPAGLTSARANQMYRLDGVQPNAVNGILDIATDVDLIAGTVTVDASSDPPTLTWTGLGATDRDADSVISDLLAAKFTQPLDLAS